MLSKSRQFKNSMGNVGAYASIIFTILVIISIIYYCFSTGINRISFDMLVNDYYETAYFASVEKNDDTYYSFEEKEDVYFSSKWGIALKDDKDLEGNKCVKIYYIDSMSPFANAKKENSRESIVISNGMLVKRIQFKTEVGNEIVTVKNGSEQIIDKLNSAIKIDEFYFASMGGGIRGSLLSTIYLILLTLVISLPLGILVALYLGNYAKDNKFIQILRTLIDMISGIPSIIFGLVGVIVFIPFVSVISNTSGLSILAGAFTMSIMILPLIIKNTEDAINAIPKSYKMNSLALGASETQTTFKVILPNAISGILTSTLLSIGRIIGESAALIFVMGSAIQDDVNIFKGATTLSVHIWTVLAAENPNYSLACSISIIILLVVFLLNILVKIICKRLNRFEVK